MDQFGEFFLGLKEAPAIFDSFETGIVKESVTWRDVNCNNKIESSLKIVFEIPAIRNGCPWLYFKNEIQLWVQTHIHTIRTQISKLLKEELTLSIQNLGFLKLHANSFRKTFANTPDPDPKISYLTYRRQFFQWIGHIVVLLLPTDIHFENPQIFATNNQTASMGAIGCPPFYAINASMQDLQNTTTSVDWYAPCSHLLAYHDFFNFLIQRWQYEVVTRDAQGLLGRRFKGPMQNDIIHSRDFDQIREIHHDPINLEKSFWQQMVKSNSHPTCFVVVVGTVGRAGVAFMKARADHTKENTILSSLSILLHRRRYPVSVYWLFTLVYWFSVPLGTQSIDSALSLGTHWVPRAC